MPSQKKPNAVYLTSKAKKRLLEHGLYLLEKTGDVQKANAFLARMQSYLKETLLAYPRIGRPASEFGKGVRKFVYQRFTVLYVIESDAVVILTIYRENLP